MREKETYKIFAGEDEHKTLEDLEQKRRGKWVHGFNSKILNFYVSKAA